MSRAIPGGQLNVLMAVKLVQPGMLSDIVSGLIFLVPESLRVRINKENAKKTLERALELGFVRLYEGRRYMLTDLGEGFIAASKLSPQLSARRLFLLKDTRRRSLPLRSDTREGH